MNLTTASQKKVSSLFPTPGWGSSSNWEWATLRSHRHQGSFRVFFFFFLSLVCDVYLVAQLVTNLPALQEAWVQSLGWEDPLEKEMTTHSSILAWEIPWTEEPGRLQSMGSHRVRHNWATKPSPSLCDVYVVVVYTCVCNIILGASQVMLMVKNPPANAGDLRDVN